MRRRALAAVPVLLLATLALGAPAQAEDSLKMYKVTVGEEGAGTLHGLGVDMSHTGYKPSIHRAQTRLVTRGSTCRRSFPART
jgi:hypothetical protein